jgi:hypothetical protein
MKEVGHAMEALLIQVQTEQLILAFRSVLLSVALLNRASIDALSERAPLISSYDLKRQQDGTKRKK